MTATTIVFDLDGTLIDTAPDLVASLNYTIAACDLEPVTFADLTHLVGQGARMMIRRAFDLRDRTLSEDQVPMLLMRFIEHYQSAMPGESKPYPGLLDALERLKLEGFILAVCTNKMESLARELLTSLDLTHHFAALTGGDSFAVRKPDPAHLVKTISLAGGDPSNAIMIGDSINDIMAAKNANLPSIAVPFGYSDVPVETLSPTRIITHFDQLTAELINELVSLAR
ncbi:phosphoglycolate phosphatase [Peteryoungia desertarenae]|uniref:Phosphoglycolate phosphatase n=1 Tax=Peteryoungia desertarenae TaxID=1813451 RepID=A0ABX6QQB3_9HYPH|nr:HAD family hydrolase [Peteryoungia desertarenae]QLF70730.1 phosphoglycolate phosphatase [Peteryoungia desertarenae]